MVVQPGCSCRISTFGDVVITGAAPGQMLRFNGSSWVNEETPYDLSYFLPGTYSSGALMAQVVLAADPFVQLYALVHRGVQMIHPAGALV